MAGKRNADLEIAITSTANQAIAEFNKFNKSVADNKKSIEAIGKSAGIAFAAVTAGLAFAIKEAVKAEEVDRRMDSQLKKMGLSSKELSNQLKDTAASIANLSNYTDDDLKASMIKLLQVTKDYNGALKYTQTAADLAARTDKTLEEATQMLSMAFVGNTARLKMQGIVLQDGVKGYAALDEISRMVAGGAQANIKPLTLLTNQMGELAESIGGPFVASMYAYATAANEGVKTLIKWNENTHGGIGMAMKYTIGLTGLVAGMAFLAPNIKKAADAAALFTKTIAANPIVATAIAVGLLTNALADYGLKQAGIKSDEQTRLASNKGLLDQAKQNLEILRNSSQPETEITEGLKKRTVSTIEYARQLGLLIPVLEKKIATDKKGNDGNPAIIEPKLKEDLKVALDTMGMDTTKFTTEQVEAYNAMYLTQDELQKAAMDARVGNLKNEQDQEIAIMAMTAEQRLEYDRQVAEAEKVQSDARLTAVGQMFGDLATLMNSGSRNMFEIGKAAAIAQAVVDTWSSAQSAFASLSGIPVIGVGLGIAAAAAAVVAGTMRVAEIQSTEFQPKKTSALGASHGVYDFRAPGNSEGLVTTLQAGESIIPRPFTEALRTGEATLGQSGGGHTFQVIIQGDVLGTPRDEFYATAAQRMGELVQSGRITAGTINGATS